MLVACSTKSADEALIRSGLVGEEKAFHAERALPVTACGGRENGSRWIQFRPIAYPHTLVDEYVEIWGVLVGLARRYL